MFIFTAQPKNAMVYLLDNNKVCMEHFQVPISFGEIKLDDYAYDGMNINAKNHKNYFEKILKALKKVYRERYPIGGLFSFESLEDFTMSIASKYLWIAIVYDGKLLYGDLFNNMTTFTQSVKQIDDIMQYLVNEIKRVTPDQAVELFARCPNYVTRQTRSYLNNLQS